MVSGASAASVRAGVKRCGSWYDLRIERVRARYLSGCPGIGPWGVAMLYMPRSGLVGRARALLATVGVLLTAIAHVSGATAFDIKKIEASVYKIYTMRKKGIGTGT